MVDRTEIFKSLIVAFLVWAIGLNGAVFADRSPAALKTGNSFHVGVCTHFSQNKGIVEMNIRSMKNAGIAAIRDEVGWSAIEREKGKLAMPERLDHYVRSASKAGLDVMLILDYSNRLYDDGDRPRSAEAVEGFCRYAEFVVRHFGNDVRLYEIWNEWDIGIGLRSPYNV
ncbi:MAG: cellulase family glycosylhydrolase, partial [Sedimentisphaerales bacterium]